MALHRVLHSLTQFLAWISLGDDTFCQALGDKASAILLIDFEDDFAGIIFSLKSLAILPRRQRVQRFLEAKSVAVCEASPAATFAVNSADLPRGTLSDSHFPVRVNVRCFARKRI